LTTIERSYLQTFPEDFKFFGTKTNLEQMIGNAVPVNLAEFLGTAILEYELNKSNMDFFNNIDFIIPETSLHRMNIKI